MTPSTAEELADALRQAGEADRTVSLGGAGSKRRMAGPVEPADVTISTSALNRVLEYDPRDLTVSVQAGLPWGALVAALAANRQMVPLDPPWAAQATVGGVIAANCSGPRRRLYGTARDFVIGMKFATMEGRLVQSGGMVVKNVAGLDMAKLMIGSFGTLAALAVVNFKVTPAPDVERSFLLVFSSAQLAFAARDALLKGVLQPSAVDVWNPLASARLGSRGWSLAIRVGGNLAAVERYEREIAALGEGVALDKPQQDELWRRVEGFTPQFLETHPDGAVVRGSFTLAGAGSAIESLEVPAILRAGSGVCHAYFERADAAAEWVAGAAGRGWKVVIECAPESRKGDLDLWPSPGNDLELMKRVKTLFDPKNLLNRGRLYRRI